MNRSKLLLASVVMLSFGACNQNKEKKITQKEKYCLDTEFKKSLDFTTVVKEQVKESIHLTGTIEGNPDKEVVFKSLINGIVTNANFALGEMVVKGQVLAEIKSTEYSALSAELNSIESQIKVATTNLKAMKSMYADGLASQKELNEAQSELDILKAQKAKTASNQSLYSASSSKEVFQIKAPATGVITQKAISAGMQISGSEESPLFTISNLDDVWIMANVYASNIQDIKEGMEVEIRTISYPDQVFKGKISMLPKVLEKESKVLKARIVIKNTDFKLKPGMLADITAFKNRNEEALSIPVSNIVFANNEPFVVVYKDDCNLEIRKIEVLTKNATSLYIKEGLEENEKIISKNQLLIFNRLINH